MTQKKPKKAANKKSVKKKTNPKILSQLKELRKKRDDARKKFDALQAEKKKRRDKIATILEKNTYSSDAEDELVRQLKLQGDPNLQKLISVLLVSRDRVRDILVNFDEEIINVLQTDTNPANVARKEWMKLEDAVEDLENKIDNIDNDCEDDEDETNLVNKIDEDDEDDDDIIDDCDDDDCDDDIDEGGPDHEGEP